MRKILRILIYILVSLLILAVLLLKPVWNRDITNTEAYQQTLEDARQFEIHDFDSKTATIAWFKVNITPELPVSMAGYYPKKAETTVHDSLYAHVIAIYSNDVVIPLISVDLIMFPPEIRKKVEKNLSGNFRAYYPYYSATHSHNSYGHWTKSFVGSVIYGTYEQEKVDFIADAIVNGIVEHKSESRKFEMAYLAINPGDYVENRIDSHQGKVDPLLRNILFKKDNGKTAILTTYAGHATIISRKSTVLSAEYPGKLRKVLEKNPEIDFSVFMAGMVGSHRIHKVPGESFTRIDNIAQILSDTIVHSLPYAKFHPLQKLKFGQSALQFEASTLRIGGRVALRNWLFDATLLPLQGKLNALQLNDVLLLGTPCDFSGEIYVNQQLSQYAKKDSLALMITSFDGDYIGYINSDQYYFTSDEEEVRALNWVGPGYGKYFTDVIKTYLDRFSYSSK